MGKTKEVPLQSKVAVCHLLNLKDWTSCGYTRPLYEYDAAGQMITQVDGGKAISLDACPRCGGVGRTGRWSFNDAYRTGTLKAIRTNKACDTSCAYATSSFCRCACGGSNHGRGA